MRLKRFGYAPERPVCVGAGWHELEMPDTSICPSSPVAGHRQGEREFVRKGLPIGPPPDAGHP
jgi:hypothetical protein